MSASTLQAERPGNAARVTSAFRSFSDRELRFLEQRLLGQIGHLGVPQTKAAAAVLAQLQDKLTALRAEQDRRRC